MKTLRTLALVLVSAFCGTCHAQVDGVGTSIIIPVVASTASFTSEIQLRDVSGLAHGISVKFYEAETSATPGPKTCATQQLQAYETRTVTLASICTLAAGSHHGFVILDDTSASKDKIFTGYSRTSNPQGIGFSVEGFPLGHIGGGEQWSQVAGVKRTAKTATAPAYGTNCFVATLDDAVDYSITVWAGAAHTITGTLQPFQMRRYLDIYAAAGAPDGDWSDTPIDFVKTNPAQQANTLIGFCTVQDNTSFGADFRIAKNWSAGDTSRSRVDCYAATYGGAYNSCVPPVTEGAPAVPDAATMVRLVTRVYAPDTVSCSIVSDRAADLEMRLVHDYPYAVAAGGSDQTSFVFSTGKRSAIDNGWHSLYWLDVGFREGGNATFPIPFGIKCVAGNGIMDPRWIYSIPDEF